MWHRFACPTLIATLPLSKDHDSWKAKMAEAVTTTVDADFAALWRESGMAEVHPLHPAGIGEDLYYQSVNSEFSQMLCRAVLLRMHVLKPMEVSRAHQIHMRMHACGG